MLIWLISKRITRLCGSSPELVWLLVSKLRKAHGSMADVEVSLGRSWDCQWYSCCWVERPRRSERWVMACFCLFSCQDSAQLGGLESDNTCAPWPCNIVAPIVTYRQYVCLCHSPREFCVMLKTALRLLLTVCLFLVQFTRSARPLVWTIVTVEHKWVKHK